MTGRQGQPSLLLGRAHNDTTRRVAQTQRSLQADFCLDYARTLVHAKLGHQLQWLDALRHSHPEHRYPLTHALEQLHCQQAGLARVNTLEGLRGTDHRRSLVETKMNCIKRLGERVMSRTFERQVNELHIRAAILNKFTELGRPQTVAVA